MFQSKKTKTYHSAMTLIELIIYLAITVIVLVVTIDMVTRIVKNRSASSGQTEATQNARYLMEKLTYAIQNANNITGSYPANNLTVTVLGATDTFTLNNGQIIFQENSGPQVALTDSKVTISPIGASNIFTKITSGTSQSVQIKFTVTYKETNFARDFQTSVLERGK